MEKPLEITFRGLAPSPAIEANVRERAAKLERFFRKIIERALVASQKRIVRNLSMPARDRYLYFRQQYPKIEQRVPQYLIASYLGITKEFLSKIKSQLIQEQ